MSQLTFFSVDRQRWADFERLFESRGGPKSCWCMAWRAKATDGKLVTGAERKRAMLRRVQDGIPIGLLGYLDGEPVAWCSVAPKTTYRALGGPNDSPENVWSLACLFVKREFRGLGLVEELIQAAVSEARLHGATILEAYPVAPDSPSYRFMGFVPTFEQAGFIHVGTAGSRRNVMRLNVQ